jgi:hypothetical protein
MITAGGWFWAIATCWADSYGFPLAVLAGLSIGQALLHRKNVNPWIWGTLSLFANSTALLLLLLAFAQVISGSSMRGVLLVFALPLLGGVISTLPQIWVMHRAGRPIVRGLLAHSLPWPGAVALLLLLHRSIGPIDELYKWRPVLLGCFVALPLGRASAKLLALPEQPAISA